MDHLGIDKPCIIRIHSTTLERELGLWCEQCLLPSAYRVLVAVELEGGPACGTVTFKGCTEHGLCPDQ